MKFITISLFACLSVHLLHKYYWLDLHEKNEKMDIAPTLILLNFETDLDHHLDIKDLKSRFYYLLIITPLCRSLRSLSVVDHFVVHLIFILRTNHKVCWFLSLLHWMNYSITPSLNKKGFISENSGIGVLGLTGNKSDFLIRFQNK